MKIRICMIVIAGLFLLGGSCLASEVSIPEIVIPELQVPEISLGKMGTDVRATIESQPISIFDYVSLGWDILFGIGEKFIKSAKPLVVFGETTRGGAEISLYEGSFFNLTAGKFLKQDNSGAPIALSEMEFEQDWFFGIEIKLSPWTNLRPQVLTYQGKWLFGLSYEFKNKEVR